MHAHSKTAVDSLVVTNSVYHNQCLIRNFNYALLFTMTEAVGSTQLALLLPNIDNLFTKTSRNSETSRSGSLCRSVITSSLLPTEIM